MHTGRAGKVQSRLGRPGLQVVAYNRGYTARVGWSWVVSSVCVMIPVLQCRVDVMMGHAYVEFLVMPGLC